MDFSAEILEELRSISPAIANIPKTNVYTNPLGYFDGLPERILALNNQAGNNLSTTKTTPYNIPANYFETLSDQIILRAKLSKDAIAEELATFAPFLNSISRRNVLHVADNYFAGVSDVVLKKIEHDNSFSILHSLKSDNFQHYSMEVRVELDSIAPILNNINKQPVLSIPQNYFDTLAIKPVIKSQGALINMFSKASSFTKYAAAAVIGALLLTGSFLFLNKSHSDSDVTASSAYKQIKEYKPDAIQSLTDQEIKEYLSTNGTGYVAPVIWDANEVEELMHQMSEEEIKQYLKENSEPSDLKSTEG